MNVGFSWVFIFWREDRVAVEDGGWVHLDRPPAQRERERESVCVWQRDRERERGAGGASGTPTGGPAREREREGSTSTGPPPSCWFAKMSCARANTKRQCGEQLLSRNVKRFRGGLVFKAHRLLYHSTLGLRVIKKKKKKWRGNTKRREVWAHEAETSGGVRGRDHIIQGYLAHKK